MTEEMTSSSFGTPPILTLSLSLAVTHSGRFLEVSSFTYKFLLATAILVFLLHVSAVTSTGLLISAMFCHYLLLYLLYKERRDLRLFPFITLEKESG
jgi:hypothetical protein